MLQASETNDSAAIKGNANRDSCLAWLTPVLIRRHQWLTACNGALNDDPFWDALHEASASTARGLRGMLEVMVGSQEALQGATVGWLELLVAELLHCYPTLHPASHLVPLMQRCQSDMEGAGLGQAAGEPSPLLPIVDGLIQVSLSC